MYEENLNGDAYDRVFQLTGVGEGTDLLDVACGSGLALQRAVARGAACTGVDMSKELLRIAAERAPSARLLHCDMEATGLPDASFDVVTSFNGIQFGGASAVAECARLLRSGGLMALAFWVYTIALVFYRVRTLILQREAHAAWVQDLPEVRA